MKSTTQRILAVIGLVLICASFLLMMVGFFAGTAKALLLNISLFCFLGAAALLLYLSYKRKQVDTPNDETQDQ